MAVPIVFIALALADIFFWKIRPTSFNMSLGYFAAEALLLSNSHVFVTFILLFYTPEARNWVGTMNRVGKIKFFGGAIASFAFFLLLYRYESWNFATVGILVFVLTMLANQFHTLCQIRGLSGLYNRMLNLGGPESERIEALLFKVTIYAYGFGTTLWVMQMFYWTVPLLLLKTVWSILTVAALALIFLHFSLPKVLFMLRLILFVLVPFSLVAVVGIGAFHSVEYFCVADKIRRNSTMENSKKRLFAWAVVTCIFLGFPVAIARHLDVVGNWTMSDYPLWLKVTVCALASFSAVHFYVDRHFFRMRVPETRRQIAPLLK